MLVLLHSIQLLNLGWLLSIWVLGGYGESVVSRGSVLDWLGILKRANIDRAPATRSRSEKMVTFFFHARASDSLLELVEHALVSRIYGVRSVSKLMSLYSWLLTHRTNLGRWNANRLLILGSIGFLTAWVSGCRILACHWLPLVIMPGLTFGGCSLELPPPCLLSVPIKHRSIFICTWFQFLDLNSVWVYLLVGLL